MGSITSNMIKKNNFLTIIFIVIIFILSLDFWGWYQSKPMFLGLPIWVYYIIFLTLLLSIFYYIFSKNIWRKDK